MKGLKCFSCGFELLINYSNWGTVSFSFIICTAICLVHLLGDDEEDDLDRISEKDLILLIKFFIHRSDPFGNQLLELERSLRQGLHSGCKWPGGGLPHCCQSPPRCWPRGYPDQQCRDRVLQNYAGITRQSHREYVRCEHSGALLDHQVLPSRHDPPEEGSHRDDRLGYRTDRSLWMYWLLGHQIRLHWTSRVSQLWIEGNYLYRMNCWKYIFLRFSSRRTDTTTSTWPVSVPTSSTLACFPDADPVSSRCWNHHMWPRRLWKLCKRIKYRVCCRDQLGSSSRSKSEEPIEWILKITWFNVFYYSPAIFLLKSTGRWWREWFEDQTQWSCLMPEEKRRVVKGELWFYR